MIACFVSMTTNHGKLLLLSVRKFRIIPDEIPIIHCTKKWAFPNNLTVCFASKRHRSRTVDIHVTFCSTNSLAKQNSFVFYFPFVRPTAYFAALTFRQPASPCSANSLVKQKSFAFYFPLVRPTANLQRSPFANQRRLAAPTFATPRLPGMILGYLSNPWIIAE